MGRKTKANADNDASQPGQKAPQTGIQPSYVAIGIAVCILGVLAASIMQKHDRRTAGGVDSANSTSGTAASDVARDDQPLGTRGAAASPLLAIRTISRSSSIDLMHFVCCVC